jgi:hypothetical protein
MQRKNNQKKPSAFQTNKLSEKNKSKEWQKPTLEDVSGRVMAQPYIRFT